MQKLLQLTQTHTNTNRHNARERHVDDWRVWWRKRIGARGNKQFKWDILSKLVKLGRTSCSFSGAFAEDSGHETARKKVRNLVRRVACRPSRKVQYKSRRARRKWDEKWARWQLKNERKSAIFLEDKHNEKEYANETTCQKQGRALLEIPRSAFKCFQRRSRNGR